MGLSWVFFLCCWSWCLLRGWNDSLWWWGSTFIFLLWTGRGSNWSLVNAKCNLFSMICWCHCMAEWDPDERSWLGDHIELFYIHYFSFNNQDGPYHSDSTASRLLSEVKHCRVELVLRWGTTLESSMFIFCFLAFCFLVWSLFWPIACWCFVVVYSSTSSTSSTSCGCSCLPDFCLFGLLWLQLLGCLVAASLSNF